MKTKVSADLDTTIDVWEEAWSLLQSTFAESPVAYTIGQQRQSAPLSVRLISAHLVQAQVNPDKVSAAHRRLLEISEGSKSRLLTELVGRAHLPAPPGITLPLVDREQQLLAKLTALDTAQLTVYGPSVTSAEDVTRPLVLQERQELLQELEDLWTHMAQADNEAAGYVALRRGTPTTWEEFAHLAAEIGSETALISFFTTGTHALLLIVRAGWQAPAIVETAFDESRWIYIQQRLMREIHISGGSSRRGDTWHQPLKALFTQAKMYLNGVTRVVFAPYSEGDLVPWSVVAERAGWRGSDQQAIPFVTLPALGLLPRLRRIVGDLVAQGFFFDADGPLSLIRDVELDIHRRVLSTVEDEVLSRARIESPDTAQELIQPLTNLQGSLEVRVQYADYTEL